MMKFGFGMGIGSIVGVVLLACGYLGMGYAGAVSDYDVAKEKTSMTMEALKKSTAQGGGKTAEELQNQLDRTTAELKRAQSIYLPVLDKTKIIGALLDIAESRGVVVSVVSSSDSVRKTDERAYPSVNFRLQIEGSYERILDFLGALEGNQPEARMEWLTSLAIDGVNLSAVIDQIETPTDGIPGVVIGGVPLSAVTEKYEGQVAIVVYGIPELIPRKASVVTSRTQPKTK